jgi:hypothetical protein
MRILINRRRSGSRECKFCNALAGVHSFNTKQTGEIKRVYSRHANCRCYIKPRAIIEGVDVFQKEKARPGSRSARRDQTSIEEVKRVILSEIRSSELIAKATQNEPSVTSTLKTLTTKIKMKLEGLQYRLKTNLSLTGKIWREGLNKEYNDVLRFTALGSPDDLVKKGQMLRTELKNRGYTETKFTNYWLKDSSNYRGVNANYETIGGYKFELQFHTPDSLAMKEINHELYDIQKPLNEMSAKWLELNEKMKANIAKLEVPKGIKDFI